MKRDDDLVRVILLRVEDADGPLSLGSMGIEGYDHHVIAYHLQLLDEAGYLHASFLYGDNVLQHATVSRLSWTGHEFLDAVRSETIWARTKSTIASTVGSASLEVVKAVATAASLKALGL